MDGPDATHDVPRRTEHDVNLKVKPTVHYPSDIHIPHPEHHHTTGNDTPPNGEYPTGRLSRPASLAGSEDEEREEDDYDWSADEDLVDEQAKFAPKMGGKRVRKGWGIVNITIFLFSSLVGSILLAALLITPALIVHFYYYLPHPTPNREYISQNISAWLSWAAFNLLSSWFLGILVDIVPSFLRSIISIGWGHVSEDVKSRIEWYMSVKDNVKPVLYAASAWVSWVVSFENIFKLYNSNGTSSASYTPRLSQVVEFSFFTVLLICIQRILSRFVAAQFHRTAYRERLTAVNEALDVIEKLRSYRPKRSSRIGTPGTGTRTPTGGILSGWGWAGHSQKEHFKLVSRRLGEGGEEKQEKEKPTKKRKNTTTPPLSVTINERPLEASEAGSLPLKVHRPHTDVAHLSPPHQRSRSRSTSPAPTPRRDHSTPPTPKATEHTGDHDATLVHSAAKIIKNTILHDARNIMGKDDLEDDKVTWNVNSKQEAKRLARSIYRTFKDPTRTYLIPSDFTPAFPTSETAQTAFRVFDTDNNSDISRSEIRSTLLRVYRERRLLARSMRDVGEALVTLDRILLAVALFVLMLIALSVFGVDVTKQLTSLYTLGIAASFVFKNAASSAFDAVMFLFVTHPFDTGDRCFIGTENLVVKKMGLFATVFTRSDGSETYYFNSQLFNMFITNVRRSGKMGEAVTLQVSWRTPLEKLDALEAHLNEWLATEENRWFEPTTSVALQHIDYQRYMEITIGIGHNGTWQDWHLRLARKTAFHAAVQFYCLELGIGGFEAPIPIDYADPETLVYRPPSPGTGTVDEEVISPISASGDVDYVGNGKPELGRRESIKPSLGFLPPAKERAALSRARKVRGRKKMIRGLGATLNIA